MNICPTTQIASCGAPGIEITPRPYLTAHWREGVTLAEINMLLPPWLALTIQQYAKREFAWFQVNNNTGGVERWFKGLVSLIGPPPPLDAGPDWHYVHPTPSSDKRHERTVTVDQTEQTA